MPADLRVSRTSWLGEKSMFERCLNPERGLPFDHREGRLIRVSSAGPKSPSERPSIEHFWLCGKCSERYVFPHEREAGIRIKLRVEEPQETAVRASVATMVTGSEWGSTKRRRLWRTRKGENENVEGAKPQRRYTASGF
jgi:hypothetical protein